MAKKIEPFVNEDLLELVREAREKTVPVAAIDPNELDKEKQDTCQNCIG
jgi:hypothetical protein